jgi:putative tricarboxylic transport membrane protein
MIKNSPDQLSGFFWVALSLFVCIESGRTGIGTLHNPGPGFLPFWSSVIFGMFGLILIITNILKKRWEGRITDLWKDVEWKKVIWVLFSLLLYSFVLSKIGFLIATFGLMTFLLSLMRRPKTWIREVATALIIALISYFLFRVFLDIQLPKGLLDL